MVWGMHRRVSHRDELVLLHIVLLERLVLFIEGIQALVVVCCHRASDAARHLQSGLLETSHAVAIVGHGHGCKEVVSVGMACT